MSLMKRKSVILSVVLAALAILSVLVVGWSFAPQNKQKGALAIGDLQRVPEKWVYSSDKSSLNTKRRELFLDSKFMENARSQGEQLYQAQCASCHGVNLEGAPGWQRANADGTMPPPPHDETGHSWHHDMQMLFDYTKFGGEEALRRRGITDVKSAMPGFGGILDDDEVRTVLAFIQSTWPEHIQRMRAQRFSKDQ